MKRHFAVIAPIACATSALCAFLAWLRKPSETHPVGRAFFAGVCRMFGIVCPGFSGIRVHIISMHAMGWFYDKIRCTHLREIRLKCNERRETSHKKPKGFDYGLRYFYDISLAEDWTLVNGVARQWVTNPGVRHGGHSFIDWWAMQTLKNPYLTPYWRMRYSRHPYQAVCWCIGAKRAFNLTDDLSLTIDLAGDLGDARNELGLFSPKPDAPSSRYRGGLHALNLVFRFDYRVTEFLNLFAFVGQYDLIMDDARKAVKASSAREAVRDLTYAGIGFELDF